MDGQLGWRGSRAALEEHLERRSIWEGWKSGEERHLGRRYIWGGGASGEEVHLGRRCIWDGGAYWAEVQRDRELGQCGVRRAAGQLGGGAAWAEEHAGAAGQSWWRRSGMEGEWVDGE